MTNLQTKTDVVANFYATLRSNDVEAWLTNFSENAIAFDPVGTPPLEGHTGLRKFMSGVLEQFETFGLTEDDIFLVPPAAAVKWTGRGRGKNGRQIEFQGIDVFEFDDDGKILSLKAYWDVAPVMAALAAPTV